MKRLLKSSFLLLLVLASPCWALDWSSLWQNNNQRGQQALEQQQFDQAAELFTDQEWQAYSHYRQGNYEKAAELFNQDNARSWYNKGNALAQLGRFDEAINAYEQALAKQPDFADAATNKALSEQLKQLQEDDEDNVQQSSEQNGDEQSDSQQQNSDSDDQGIQQDDGDRTIRQPSEQDDEQFDSQQPSEQADKEENDNKQSAAEQGDEAEENANDTAVQQNDEPKDNTDEETTAQTMQESELNAEELEQQQQLEQWLRSVPDDPGQLLRNKFRYQYEQNLRRQQHIDKESDQLW